GIHDDHEVKADVRLERLRAGDESARHRGDAHAEAEGEAMTPVDVDADIGGRDRVVGGGAQGLAEGRACEEGVEGYGAQDGEDRSEGWRLIEQDLPHLP